jgi:hypothetical protein
MRQALTLSTIVGIAFATLAVASVAAMRDAGERSIRQQHELNAIIDRMLAERLARRDEPDAFVDAPPGRAAPSDMTAALSRAAAENVIPRERPTNLDADEDRKQAREAAAARMKAKRRVARIPIIRPERLIPDTFRTIRAMTFGLMR